MTSSLVGSGSRIRIRGYSTFSLTPDPLIYVDGIRVNNDAQSGFAMQAFGSSVISRLNDFDPDQIESIEILKGPAAATLYGTEAARGVINIITKKGAPGGTRYSISMKQGANWFSNPQGRLPVNYWLNPATNQVESLNIYARDKAAGYEAFRTGRMQTYNFNVSGGAERIRYFIAADIDHNQGAEPDNFKNATSGRVNVEIQPSEKLSITASSGYVASRMGLSCESGCGGAMWEIVFSNPANLPQFACAGSDDPACGYALGYQSNSPRVDRQMKDWQAVGRYTGSVTANWRPLKFMTHRLTIGTDVTQEKNTEYMPYLVDDTARYLWNASVRDGYRFENRRQVNYNTLDYAGTVSFDVRPGLNAATSLGVQYYQRHNEYVEAQGNGYAGPGLGTIRAAATKPYASSDWDDNNTLGFYGQEQLGFNDRLFVTGALRVDNNSAFGSDIKWVTYPKASLSWVLSEEPGVRARMPGFVSAFKLRAAYGESGQQPPSFVALRTFSPATGPGDTPAITPNTLGNPDLKPERGKEIEAGFEAGFLNDRLGLDLTYYHTTTVDAILLRDIAPSTGFGGVGKQQYVNAGSIVNQGIEALLKAQLVNRRSFSWDMNFNVATNTGKVTRLNGTDTTLVSGDLQWKIGYQPRAWFRERIVSAEFDPTTKRAINVMCDDGAGGSTPCFNAAGQVIAPRVYLGRTVPAVEGSIGTNFRFFQRLSVSGLLDFKTGFKKFDNNLRVRCQIFNTCLENIYPERYDPKFIAAMQTNNTIKDWVIRDASFAKLREIAVTYTVPESYVRSFGARSASINVAARNLHTFTKWTGLDPEASMLSGATLEQDNLPQLMSFVTTINLNF
ncbi:MAG: TonB-dependent receptor [Gemmatimonadetes bacterium]|nr:TonB-dependent receptor [Gemmatimonadota bacterium]